MFKKILIALLISNISIRVIGTPVDNGVSGEPEVQCSSDSLLVNFNVQNPFEGHVYVKGHYDEKDCRSDATNTKSTKISVPFSSCGVRRQRSTNPLGIYVSATIVISFHPMFVTKVDRAYNVRCFYMSADKTVTANLDVSMLTTQLLTQNIPMPVCKYEVLDNGPNGSPVRYATVGQPVYHKWTCQSEAGGIFCMTVHSCVVDDGQNKRVQLLDENGCAQDKYLMANLNYTNDLSGGVESHVFKYADKPTLFFQCQIRLTLKEGNQCSRTSDSCPAPTRGKRSATGNYTRPGHRNEENPKKKGESFDVFSEPLIIIDVDDKYVTPKELQKAEAEAQNFLQEDLNNSKDGKFCLSTITFGVLLGVLIIVFLASLVAVTIICIQRSSSVVVNSSKNKL